MKHLKNKRRGCDLQELKKKNVNMLRKSPALDEIGVFRLERHLVFLK